LKVAGCRLFKSPPFGRIPEGFFIADEASLNPHRVDLKSLTLEQLEIFLAELGQKRYRAKQILHWIYPRQVTDFASMTDLGKALRSQLQEQAYVSDWSAEVVQQSADGTRKYLFRLADGESVEAVKIPMEEGRATLCISTQVGCSMGCRFCMTGSFGLVRNLQAAEIVNQVCGVLKDGPITNIVLMGMGEPLDNLEQVVQALQILYLDDGLGYGTRRVTLSTCGLVPQIRRLAGLLKVQLAVSLNAADDAVRNQLMPINRAYPLAELLPACRDYAVMTGQRVTFEYILIAGVNDSLAAARKLVKRLHGLRCKVNLIAYNEHAGSSFQAPQAETVKAFQNHLLQHGMVATLRASRGQDIAAACGQLKGQLEKCQDFCQAT
jgi:23S rRNA (adenine2503-C2)-methyltransferase